MEVEITLNADDLAQVERMIDNVTRVLSFPGISQFLKEKAQPYISKRAAERFRSGGDDASGQWRPLSDATQRWRKWCADKYGLAIGPSAPINVRTGALRDWVTNTYGIKMHGPYVGGAVELFVPGKIPDPWMAIKLKHAQQGGFTRYFSGFPPRPVAVVSLVDSVVLTRLAGAWFDDMFAKLA